MHRFVAVAWLAGCASQAPTPPPRPPIATVPATAPASPGIELPEVSMLGYVAADAVQARIAVSPSAFTIEGKQVLALRDGVIAATDRSKLHGAIDSSVATGVPGLALAFDRRVPFSTLAETVRVVSERGASRFQILARAGASQVGVAFERASLPRPVPPSERGKDTGQRRPYRGDPVYDLQAEVIDDARGLERCLPTSPKERQALQGRFVLQLVVMPHGRVEHVKMRGADAYQACFGKLIEGWYFEDVPHPVGYVLAYDLPSFHTRVDPRSAVGAHAQSFRPEIRNGKPVHVIDTVIDGPSALEPVVTITETQLLVWSRTGRSSSREKPAATIDRTAKTAITDLNEALGGLVRDELWDGVRFPIDQQVTVEVTDPAVQMQLVAEVLGALQVAPDGFPLFADVRLAVP